MSQNVWLFAGSRKVFFALEGVSSIGWAGEAILCNVNHTAVLFSFKYTDSVNNTMSRNVCKNMESLWVHLAMAYFFLSARLFYIRRYGYLLAALANTLQWELGDGFSNVNPSSVSCVRCAQKMQSRLRVRLLVEESRSDAPSSEKSCASCKSECRSLRKVRWAWPCSLSGSTAIP